MVEGTMTSLRIKHLINLLNRYRIAYGAFAFFMAFMVVGLSTSYIHVLVSETHSLPYHYFVHLPHVNPQKGDLSVIASTWVQKNIIKMIIGTEGDRLSYDNEGCLWVNDHKVGKPYAVSTTGRPLHPIRSGVIPKDYVFVYSPHVRSFDSRYEELGLVHKAFLQGSAIGLA
jgi:signal peptidase I